MAFVEGKGFTTPNPISIQFSDKECRDLFAQVKVLAKTRGWQLNNSYMGFLGESAIGKYLYLHLQSRHKTRLDIFDTASDGGVDIEIYGLKLQIKTKRLESDCLVPRLTEDRKIIPLNSDYYIFCDYISNSHISILGCIRRSDLLKYATTTNKFNKSYLSIQSKFLFSIDTLINMLISMKVANYVFDPLPR